MLLRIFKFTWTPGGSVYAGLEFMTRCNTSSQMLLQFVQVWRFYGAVLLCAGAEGKRSALPHWVMIHQPSGAQVATDMEINLREMLKLKDELYNITHHSGQTLTKYTKIRAWLLDESRWGKNTEWLMKYWEEDKNNRKSKVLKSNALLDFKTFDFKL
jgi:ATP-dependent protease ClpP protease subunit